MKGVSEMEHTSQCTAAESVVRAYADTVYRLAFAAVRNRMDAEDVFQEVFLRYFRKKRLFESEEHRKAWLLRVTVNCAKDQKIAACRRRSETFEGPGACDASRDYELEAALNALRPNQRAVVHLFYFEDLPVKQISCILGLRESHVRTLLTRARDSLRNHLKGEEDV